MEFKQLRAIASIIGSTPRYVIFRGYRLGIELVLGRRLTVKEGRKLYAHLQREFYKLEESDLNDDSLYF